MGSDDGTRCEHAGSAEGVPAAREELETDAEGRHRLQGLGIDIALLPINEDRPAGGRNLNGAEAADLALSIGVQIAIPCHYEMFELNTAPPTAFEEQMSDPGSAKCVKGCI